MVLFPHLLPVVPLPLLLLRSVLLLSLSLHPFNVVALVPLIKNLSLQLPLQLPLPTALPLLPTLTLVHLIKVLPILLPLLLARLALLYIMSLPSSLSYRSPCLIFLSFTSYPS